MSSKPIVRFSQPNLKLSKKEKEVIKKLIEAAQSIVPIYQKQENQEYLGANFYPTDVTREEVVKTAKHNKQILSPYTVIKRDIKKNLIAIPYHVEYKTELQKTADLIKQAAKISDNKDFSNRLRLQANALLDGSYEASDIYWLSMKPYKINFVIGPIERYDDKLFFTKCTYQSWLGVMDEKMTQEATNFKDFIISSRRKILTQSEKVDFLDKMQIRVDNTLIFTGLISRFMFTSANLPNDVNLMEKHGSEVTIFKPSFNLKFDTEKHPIFHSIFEEKFQQGYPVKILKEADLKNSYLHEISHSMTRYRDAERRLKEYFPIFDEITASIFGVRACGSLLLKDVITQKEIEAIMVMFIVRAFSWWLSYLKEPSVIHYAQGFAISLNFFLESGAIREANGFSWPNFTKLFVSIDELTDTLERILAIGTYDDAKKFVDNYAALSIYERFVPNLKKLL